MKKIITLIIIGIAFVAQSAQADTLSDLVKPNTLARCSQDKKDLETKITEAIAIKELSDKEFNKTILSLKDNIIVLERRITNLETENQKLIVQYENQIELLKQTISSKESEVEKIKANPTIQKVYVPVETKKKEEPKNEEIIINKEVKAEEIPQQPIVEKKSVWNKIINWFK